MSTILLMHFDGTNGSTTFKDSSLNSVTYNVDVSNAGAPIISTTQSKFGGSSYQGNITGGFPGGPIGIMGQGPDIWTGEWTVEFWGYFLHNFSSSGYFAVGTNIPTGTSPWGPNVPVSVPTMSFGHGSTGQVSCDIRDANSNNVGAAFQQSVPFNAWFHAAFVSSAGKIALYLNGTKDGTTINLPAANVFSGMVYYNPGSSRGFGQQPYTQGYMDDLRVSNVAIYTASFTVPTGPFTDPVAPPMIGIHT